MRIVPNLVLTLLVLVGCGGAGPTPAPAGFADVVAALVRNGGTVHEHVSGDDGCERVELHDNAARLSVSLAEDPTPRDVYVFRWRRATDFDGSVQDFFMCVGDFRSNRPGTVVEVVERAPWRAFGADWTAALKAAVTQALDQSPSG